MKGLIAIADDDTLSRMLLERELFGLGYEVVSFESGQRLLEGMQSRLPDVLILDQEMPVMKGDATLAAWHEQHGSGIPAILLTGHASFSGGDLFDLVLVKPVSSSMLGSSLQTLLGGVTPPEAAECKERILEVCNGDTNFAKEMTAIFLQQWESEKESVTGMKLPEDKERWKAYLHRIKSSLGYLGLHAFRLRVLEMEQNAKQDEATQGQVSEFVAAMSASVEVLKGISWE